MESTAPNPKPQPRGPRRGGAELLKHHCPAPLSKLGSSSAAPHPMPASPLLLEPAHCPVPARLLSRQLAGTGRALHCSPQFSPLSLHQSACGCPVYSLLLPLGSDLIPVVAKKGKEMREGVEKKLEPVLPGTAGGGGGGGVYV